MILNDGGWLIITHEMLTLKVPNVEPVFGSHKQVFQSCPLESFVKRTSNFPDIFNFSLKSLKI